MYTYFIYCFILCFSSLSAYLYQGTKDKDKGLRLVWYGGAFLIPFFFLAIRYDIGTDYQNYVNYYYRIIGGEDIAKEPAYLALNNLIHYFDLNIQWLFVFFGFFFVYFSYKAFPLKHFAICIFFFICIVYLHEGFSIIRQGLAVAIMAYAIKYVQRRDFFRYCLCATVAMTFHLMSGLLWLIVYPFLRVNLNRFVYIGLLLTTYLSVEYFHIIDILFDIAISMFPKYEWYLESTFMKEATTSGVLGPAIKLTIAMGIFLAKNRMQSRDGDSVIIINLFFLYVIGYILHLQVSILGRVEHVFVFSSILIIPYFLEIFEKKSRFFVLLFFVLFYGMLFLRYIYNGTIEVDNDIYINPYQTIWD